MPRPPGLIRAGAALLALLPTMTPAQDVTLRAGDMAVAGRLKAHDGTLYVLETEHGPLALAASAVTCEGEGCPEVPELVVEGDATLVRVLMPALIEAFAARRGVTLEREASGYRLLDGGEALRLVLRPAEGRGARMAWGPADPGSDGAEGHVVALDALVLVVSPRNPVAALPRDALARLFSGRVADWAELGAEVGPPSLHVLEGPVATALEERLLRPTGLEPSGTITHHADARSLARAVAADPGAVGATDLGGVGVARALAIEGACGVVSHPDADAVRSGDWPLGVPVVAVLPAHPLPRLAADLAAFATSPEAQPIIRRAGLLDHTPREVPLARQGERLAAAILSAAGTGSLDALQGTVAELRGLTRLTPTFRFEGGLRLDGASRGAVERLAADISSGAYDGRRLVFMGFGDGTGAPDRTKAISRDRARAVMEAVRARVSPRPTGPILRAVGHGATLPIACDDTAEGRRLNRRVELWAR